MHCCTCTESETRAMYHTITFDYMRLDQAKMFAQELWHNIRAWRKGASVETYFDNLLTQQPFTAAEFLQSVVQAQHLYEDTTFAIDVPIVGHCNLRCRGCAAASPLTPQWFANTAQLQSTLTAYAKLCTKNPPREVNLVGGEPTLHPRLGDIVTIVRRVFPHTQLTIITNGLTLQIMSDRTLKLLTNMQVNIHVSVYGPRTMFSIAPLALNAANWSCTTCFRHTPIVYQNIRCVEYCSIPLLPNGDLCFCTVIPTAAYLAPLANFNLEIQRGLNGDVVNIFDITREQLLTFLQRPSCPFERFCSQPRTIPWDEDKDLKWWLTSSNKSL